jgi:type I restriction enzyme S subunit
MDFLRNWDMSKEQFIYPQKKIVDVAVVDPGNLPESTLSSFSFKYIDLSAVKVGTISDDIELITFSDAPSRARRIVKNHDILMATVRPNLQGFAKVGELRDNTVASTGFAVLRTEGICDSDFLYQNLFSDAITSQIEELVVGSNYPAINSSDIKCLNIPFPSLKAQRKIARILSTVDNLIEKTQSLIDKYTAVKQGMMLDLFTRGIDLSGSPETNKNFGQLRPSFSEAPELYQETELGWVPKDWEVQPLGHFLSMITYGFTNPMPVTEDGPWMVTAANVIGGRIDYKKTRKTSVEAFNTLLTQKSKPLVGDILLTKDGTLGRLAIVDNEYLCINQSVALLRCNDKAKPDFIKLLLETERYYQKMLDDAGGSAIKHIYITIVDKMLIAMPTSSEEQNAVYEKANAINEKIEIEKQFLEKSHLQKKGLMQDLLTGKVKV